VDIAIPTSTFYPERFATDRSHNSAALLGWLVAARGSGRTFLCSTIPGALTTPSIVLTSQSSDARSTPVLVAWSFGSTAAPSPNLGMASTRRLSCATARYIETTDALATTRRRAEEDGDAVGPSSASFSSIHFHFEGRMAATTSTW
jgi:hypothetical protein